jgi:hypothetical protein
MTPADWKLEAGVRMVRGGLGIVTLAIALLGTPPAVSAGTLYVDQAAAGCSDSRSAVQAGALTPWCSLAPAASAARPGDVVRVARGTYRGTFRPLVSGTATSEASAVFVAEAVSLEVRNTHVCYDGADDLGIALWINSGSRVGTLSANTNWYCSRDARARHVAYDGSRTTTSAWRAVTGADSASAFSAPPAYDSRSRPLSPLAGAGIGAPLAAVPADFDGLAWPAAGPRDAGAFRLAP